MKRVSLLIAFLLSLLLVLGTAKVYPVLTQSLSPETLAQSKPARKPAQNSKIPRPTRPTPQASPSVRRSPSKGIPKPGTPPKPPSSFDQAVLGMQRLDGLFTLYRDRTGGKLYAEIKPDQLNINYLSTLTLESGLGEGGLYSGLPLADFLFNFRYVNKRLQFTIPNLFFRTNPGDPLQRSVQRSFSNSVLRALPVQAVHPERKSYLVDLAPLLLTDLPGLTPVLPMMLGASYALDTSKSYYGRIKTFPQNVELESVYGFSGGTSPEEMPGFVSTLPDSRSFNLRVRYSWSQLPVNNGYRPRLADDRVGYFITAYQNFSDDSPRTPFVRYINRWHLEKQDPTALLSPPKKPIVFWIENTVPLEYREAVRDGILMWNKAFEKAGFKDAIQAQQMPDRADWDPADIRYNTIRWLTTFDGGFLGIGPSRVNPITGEILDADILIDASFSRYLKQQYQTLVQQSQMRSMPALAKLTGKPNLCNYGTDAYFLEETFKPPTNSRLAFQLLGNYDLCFGLEANQQLAMGALSLSMLQNVTPSNERMKQFVQQYLRMLIAHEVGHTLGLRHNFRASSMLQPEDLNKLELTREKGLVGSVMDYSAVNLAPEGTPQGDYFTQVVGPYDEWAISYGYSPTDAKLPQSETRFLEAIARRAPEPDLAYATDEDIFARLDPQTNAFDLSGNLLTYAPWQLDNAQRMWQKLDRHYPTSGQDYNDLRVIFDEIFDYYFQYSRFLTTYVGGQFFNRYRAGDAVGRLPFEPVPLEKQRQALALLQKYVFDETRFRFSAKLLNQLAPSRWNHWGQDPDISPLEYPIYDRILLLQSIMLRNLLSNVRLSRLQDIELKTQPGQALTIPELFDSLQTDLWREVLQPAENLQLSSLRRGLQREHLNLMIRMVLRTTRVPEDARSVAWYELRQLRTALDNALRRRGDGMDTYTRAHLEETRDRITKALDAQLQSQ